jgi:hypothetical protein
VGATGSNAGAIACAPGAAAGDAGAASTQPRDLLAGSSGLVGILGVCAQADAAIANATVKAIAWEERFIVSTFRPDCHPMVRCVDAYNGSFRGRV